MNGKDLLNKMSDVDPKLIEDANKKPRRSRKLFIGITSGAAATAAAALIAVAIGNSAAQKPPIVNTSDPASSVPVTSDIVNSGNTSTQDPPVVDLTPKDPPKLDFSKYKGLKKISLGNHGVSGQGGDTLGEVKERSFRYSDLQISSPWKGAELETMPVFMSHSTDLNQDVEKMYALAREAAAALGIPEDSLEFTDNYYDMSESIEQQRRLGKENGATDEEIEDVINRMIRQSRSMTHVEAVNDNVRISVDSAFGVFVYFEEPIKIPDEYNFNKDTATDEERAAVLSYLSDKFKDLIKFSKPTAGDGLPKETGGFSLYDADGDLTQQIINFRVNAVCFTDNSDGNLKVIDINSDGACEKLGDYPILTAKQAEEVLKSNKYNDNTRMPANAKILKTDMIYKNAPGYTAVMPYYEFYVETDKDPGSDADVVCNVYTIPAVPEEFIDMETGDYGVRA